MEFHTPSMDIKVEENTLMGKVVSLGILGLKDMVESLGTLELKVMVARKEEKMVKVEKITSGTTIINSGTIVPNRTVHRTRSSSSKRLQGSPLTIMLVFLPLITQVVQSNTCKSCV